MQTTKYTYKISVDKNADMWNWWNAAQNETGYGKTWGDYLKYTAKEIYGEIKGKNKREAFAILRPFLDRLYKTNNNFQASKNKLEKNLAKNFDQACVALEKITGKKLYFQEYKLYLTTFPRCPYNPDEGSLYVRDNDGDPIGGFMHEVLHFQMHNYWEKNPKSSVSKLSEKDFHDLKEALTVVLDEDLVPAIIKKPDRGYDMHQEFRKILHKHWQEHHDFDKLVEFGVEKLPKFPAGS
jgi:hypothetical protein